MSTDTLQVKPARADVEKEIAKLDSIKTAKSAFVFGDFDNAQARAAIIQAESMQRQAEVLETFLEIITPIAASGQFERLITALEALAAK
jgi:hypothetical protein